MGERIVYSTLCHLRGAPAADVEPLLEMASLWSASLRNRACFNGRVLLLTNLEDIRINDVELVRAPFDAVDRRHLFLERVRRYACLSVRPDDQIMQMDLDALAVAPLDPIFNAIRAGVLLAARSGSSPLIHDHAGGLMTRPQRWAYRLRGWDHRAGVSACVTACDGATWRPVMRRWAATFRRIGRDRPVPPLGDQSFLNWLFLTGQTRIQRLPRSFILHVRSPQCSLDGPAIRQAVVLHFPFKQRLDAMRAVSVAAKG